MWTLGNLSTCTLILLLSICTLQTLQETFVLQKIFGMIPFLLFAEPFLMHPHNILYPCVLEPPWTSFPPFGLEFFLILQVPWVHSSPHRCLFFSGNYSRASSLFFWHVPHVPLSFYLLCFLFCFVLLLICFVFF